MRLVALREIGDVIGVIRPGQVFIQPDEDRAQTMIRSGLAEPETGLWRGLRWRGMAVAILASGPSLTRRQVERVRDWRKAAADRRVIAINTTFRLAPWADVLYACDVRWWMHYMDEVKAEFRGALWSQDADAQRRFGVNLIHSQNARGLGKRPGVIHQGMNSGFQAINLAWQGGAARVVLLGYDAKAKDGRKHWHGDHPGHMNGPLPCAGWIKAFEAMADDLRAEGFDIVNATPGSALACFPRASLEVALV